MGNCFLIVQGVDADDGAFHNIADDVVLIAEQQGAHGNQADQDAAVVDHITQIDCLFVHAGAADAFESVLHGHIGCQADEFRRHDAAGAVFRVFHQFIDGFPAFRVAVAQDAVHYAGGHFFNHVHSIVEVHLLQHFLQLGIAE